MKQAIGKKAFVAIVKDEVKGFSRPMIGPSEMHSIYKVPTALKIIDPEDYTPKVVSIGPLHHGKNKFNEMEDTKKDNLQRILEKGDENKLDKFFDIVYNLLDKVRGSYSEELEGISDNDLAKILVFDGLFLISLFISPVLSGRDDFMLTIHRKIVWTDLFLLENQVPFFVIEELFEEAKSLYLVVDPTNLNLVNLALRFLKINPPQKMIPGQSVKHLLHLMHLSLCSYSDGNRCQGKSQLKLFGLKEVTAYIFEILLCLVYRVIFCNGYGLLGTAQPYRDQLKAQSASELVKKGLTIQMKTTDGLQILFNDGTLEIPRFFPTSSTSFNLKNLLAFEQCCREVKPDFTSYVNFMGKLIKSTDDICILRERQIIVSDSLTDSEVVNMFCHHQKNLLMKQRKDLSESIYQNVIDFCEVPYRRWRRSLQEDYFNCLWKIIKTIVGFLFLLFGAIQTYLACFK